MFSPEDTIIGFIAGIKGLSVTAVEPSLSLYVDLRFLTTDRVILGELIAAEYGIQVTRSETVAWVDVSDVIAFVYAHRHPPAADLDVVAAEDRVREATDEVSCVERCAGIDMLPEVVS